MPAGILGKIGFWLMMSLAAVLAAAGLALAGGGIYLIVLGGSWYYVIAGLALVATAWFLYQRSRVAVMIYTVLFAATVAWALWESGFNGWAQIPRIFTPFVGLVMVLACLPALKHGPRFGRSAGTASVMALAGVMTVGVVLNPSDSPLNAQEAIPGTPIEQPAAGLEVAFDTTFPTTEVGVDWPAYGGSNLANRYSPLDQVTKENVAQLEKLWEFRTGDLPENDEPYGNQNTPVKVGDRLFVCSALNKISALDAATGAEFWTYDPGVSADNVGYNASCRGLVYFDNPAAEDTELCATRTVNLTHDAHDRAGHRNRPTLHRFWQ